MSVSGLEPHVYAGNRRWRGAISFGVAALALAGCAPPQAPSVSYSHGHEHFAQGKKWGHASPKVVADGERVPRGGGQYLVGRPYTVAGRRYYPAENPSYTATGMASWYGAAFHGRRTANGEVYDMASLSAAHPTMPLPSYARVTNLENGYSVVVRVNDRGPYHPGRVMDVSSRVADVLDMKAMGTAKVKVDYVGPAPIEGSDNSQLLASLRTDGSPANMIGYSAPVMMANAAAEQTDTIWSFFSGGGRGGQQPQPQPAAQPAPAPAPAQSPRRSRSRALLSLPRRLSRCGSRPRPWFLTLRRLNPATVTRYRPSRSVPPILRRAPFRCRRPGHSISASVTAHRSWRLPPRLRHARRCGSRPRLLSCRHAGPNFMPAPRGSLLPPKKPTTGAFDHVKSAKTARADY